MSAPKNTSRLAKTLQNSSEKLKMLIGILREEYIDIFRVVGKNSYTLTQNGQPSST